MYRPKQEAMGWPNISDAELYPEGERHMCLTFYSPRGQDPELVSEEVLDRILSLAETHDPKLYELLTGQSCTSATV